MPDQIHRPAAATDDDVMEVVIVRNVDGAQRIDKPGWKPGGVYTWASEFWWTEGNLACDCNRRLHWARAADPRESEDGLSEECGHTEFSVILRAPVAN